jgi:tetratricopeptide (TPR) repeat protein
LERSLQSNATFKAAASKFVVHHIHCDNDKAGWSAWLQKYKPAGGSIGIPAIWIVKPNGEQAHFQSGAKDFVLTLNKFGKTLATAAALTPKTVGLMKAAAKQADALLEEGKFVSAYEKLAEYSEELKDDNKLLTKIKATMKKIEEAALEKIDSAKELVETGKSEGKRLDGAYQLAVIAGNMESCEGVGDKAESTIAALKKESKNADLFKQAALLYEAREAVREEDNAQAKKLYEKAIADFKETEAARRAKTRLDELKVDK